MEILEVPTVNIHGREIPRILLGTSPFIAAGQFGPKSFKYYIEFVVRRGNIKKIVAYCLRMGIRGIQLLPYDFVSEEIWEAYKETGIKPIVVGTLVPDEPRALEWLIKFEAPICLAHASIADRLDKEQLIHYLELIRGYGMIPGIATHTPYKTLRWAMKEFDRKYIKVIMGPFNYAGLFLDAPLEVIEKLYSELHGLGIAIITKKVLGAGSLDIEKAISYAFNKPYISAWAIGVASIEEANTTFRIAIKYCYISLNTS